MLELANLDILDCHCRGRAESERKIDNVSIDIHCTRHALNLCPANRSQSRGMNETPRDGCSRRAGIDKPKRFDMRLERAASSPRGSIRPASVDSDLQQNADIGVVVAANGRHEKTTLGRR